MTRELDTVLVEVIGSALATIVEEMSGTLVRAAFSTNIKERRDCTAGLFDAAGRGIAQDEGGSPLHLGSLMGIVDSILARSPATRSGTGTRSSATTRTTAAARTCRTSCWRRPSSSTVS